jgi:hypothetical protein
MRVYRIESSNGQGPFAGNANVSEENWHLFIHVNALPLPRHDNFRKFNIYRDSSLVCGCSSLEQLQEWFPYEVMSVLDDSDYCLATYEVNVNDLDIGGSQVLFRQKASVCVSRVPVYELYSYSY